MRNGATGGGLQPLSQSILLEAFPPEGRGKAMAFWALGIVVAPMLGPVLGGWITDSYSWRWLFYINLPIGIAATLMAKFFIFDPPYIRRQSAYVDWWGIGFLAVGSGARLRRAALSHRDAPPLTSQTPGSSLPPSRDE